MFNKLFRRDPREGFQRRYRWITVSKPARTAGLASSVSPRKKGEAKLRFSGFHGSLPFEFLDSRDDLDKPLVTIQTAELLTAWPVIGALPGASSELEVRVSRNILPI